MEVDALSHFIREKYRRRTMRGVLPARAEVGLYRLTVRDPPKTIRCATKDGLHCPLIALGLVPNNEVRMVTAAGKRLSEDFERIRALSK